MSSRTIASTAAFCSAVSGSAATAGRLVRKVAAATAATKWRRTMDMRSPGLGSAVLLVDLALGEILDVERAQCRRPALRQHRLGTLRLAPGLPPLALPGALLGARTSSVWGTSVSDRV